MVNQVGLWCNGLVTVIDEGAANQMGLWCKGCV